MVSAVEEVRAVMEGLDGVEAFVVGVLYRGGLRLMEALRPRLKTLIFSVYRSRCAMAKVRRLAVRCCPREWQRSSRPTWRMGDVCIARTSRRLWEGAPSAHLGQDVSPCTAGVGLVTVGSATPSLAQPRNQ